MSLSPLKYGTVKGRFIAAVADTTNDVDDEPDAIPLTGKVTFRPDVQAILVGNGSEAPVTVMPAPITAQLDSQGYLTLNGQRGVKLIATDNIEANPTNFTYTVELDLRYQSTPVKYPGWSIEVPADRETDLTLQGRVPSASGTAIIRGASVTDITAENGIITFLLSDSTSHQISINGTLVSSVDGLTGQVDLTETYAGKNDVVNEVNGQKGSVTVGDMRAEDIADPLSAERVALDAIYQTETEARASYLPIDIESSAALKRGVHLRKEYQKVQDRVIPGLSVGNLATQDTPPLRSVPLGTAALNQATDDITTTAPHGLVAGDRVRFMGATSLPSGVSNTTDYYVRTVVSTTTFQIQNSGGGRITWTTDGSGPLYKYPYALENAYIHSAGTPNPRMRFKNGKPVRGGDSYPWRDWVMSDRSTQTYGTGSFEGPRVEMETMMAGTTVEILPVHYSGQPTRIWVEGKLVKTITPADFTALGIATGRVGRLSLTFPDASPRRLTIEAELGFIAGLERLDNETISAPTEPPAAPTMFQGDSFTTGDSAGLTGMPYALWAQRLLRWKNIWRAGASGAGYLRDGSIVALSDRWQTDIVTHKPARLVLLHGHNDANFTLPEVIAAAETVIDGVSEALPDIDIIVVGPWANKGKAYMSSQFVAVDNAIHDIAVARGLRFISPLREEWITGNGHAGAPNGMGNADTYISSDTVHPTPAGHEYLGQRLAGHLAHETSPVLESGDARFKLGVRSDGTLTTTAI